MAKINNPRFPHHCIIYKMTGSTPFDDGIKVIVYEGKCRKYMNSSTFGKPIESKYELSIPGTIDGIEKGISVDISDLNGSYSGYVVVDSNSGNMGTTVYINSTSTNG